LGDNFLRGYYQAYDMANAKVGLKGSGVVQGEYVEIETITYSSQEDDDDDDSGKKKFDLSDFSLWTTWVFFACMFFLIIVIVWVSIRCARAKKEDDYQGPRQMEYQQNNQGMVDAVNRRPRGPEALNQQRRAVSPVNNDVAYANQFSTNQQMAAMMQREYEEALKKSKAEQQEYDRVIQQSLAEQSRVGNNSFPASYNNNYQGEYGNYNMPPPPVGAPDNIMGSVGP